MRRISKEKLKHLVDQSVYDRLELGEYLVGRVDPQTLVSALRLDLGFKLLYLDNFEKSPEYANHIYNLEIAAQTKYEMVDPDNIQINSLNKFKNKYAALANSIHENGFDPEVSLIPLSCNNVPINGSHRLSLAIKKRTQVDVVLTELPNMIIDYRVYDSRRVPAESIEAASYRLLKEMKDLYCAILWPSGKSNWTQTSSLFSNVIYEKTLSLSDIGQQNILWLCYQHMDWIGDETDNYYGLKKKKFECFNPNGDIKIIFFQSDSLQKVRRIKAEIRDICNIGFSAIHITDNRDEAMLLADFLLQPKVNGLLNFTNLQILDYLKWIKELCDELSLLEKDKMVVVGGKVLELYGLRKASDLDVLYLGEKKLSEQIDVHNTYYAQQDLCVSDIVYLPSNHITLFGVKFICIDQLMKFKKQRGELKDIIDIGNYEKSVGLREQKIPDVLRKHRLEIYFRLRRYRATIIRILTILKLIKLVKLILGKK